MSTDATRLWAVAGRSTPATYYDRHLRIRAVKLVPGEHFATGEDRVIVTVLGSCVAACVRDPIARVGGMNHFMIPASDSSTIHPVDRGTRYGVYAMELLLTDLMKCGAQRDRLEAKVFGGGAVLRGVNALDLGTRSSNFLLRYLATERIPVIAQDLLDTHPRKIYYFPRSGRVLVKRLRSMHNDTIIRREQEYASRISGDRVGGDIELFD